MKLIGRKSEIKQMSSRDIRDPENKAFFGVKGLGKTAIIESVFSKANCRMYAEEYQALYVRTILQADMKGEDLIEFLLDIVTNGIDLINDESIREEINQEIDLSRNRFHRKDSVLRQALEIIKEHGFDLVLVMDEFHNMGRNSEVGSEQYDFLRSLNELALVYYWIISDSDFSDVYATSQFTTSFFAQKFNPKTIPQMNREDMTELLAEKAHRLGIDLTAGVKDSIYEVIGGIPGFALSAIKCAEELGYINEGAFVREKYIDYLLEDASCISLMTSWSRSLTMEQKQILLDFSEREIIYEDEIVSVRDINQLGDKSGLGLLIHGSDDKGNYWRINTELYREFVISKSEDFFAADVTPAKTSIEIVQPAPTYITNYFTVNNNFFNPDAAVNSLLLLKGMAEQSGRLLLPDQARIAEAVQCLPYQKPGEQQTEEQLVEFADKTLTSGEFRADALSEDQMQRFHLTQSLLNHLSPTTTDSLISAIQVYDLLQLCVKNYGLNMMNSESARGILFARLYESILKERLCPAFNSVYDIATKEIRIDQMTLFVKDAPPEKMTIGNFVFILKDRAIQQKLASICRSEVNRSNCDIQWWKDHKNCMDRIGKLRNDCCHSGSNFDAAKLEQLIHYIFELPTLASIEVYDDITSRP